MKNKGSNTYGARGYLSSPPSRRRIHRRIAAESPPQRWQTTVVSAGVVALGTLAFAAGLYLGQARSTLPPAPPWQAWSDRSAAQFAVTTQHAETMQEELVALRHELQETKELVVNVGPCERRRGLPMRTALRSRDGKNRDEGIPEGARGGKTCAAGDPLCY